MSARESRGATAWALTPLLMLLLLAPDARAEWCGDGVLDPEESCDLGIGNDAGKSCTRDCTVAACGDGDRTTEEPCDDGNVVSGDGCSAECRDESQPRWSVTADRHAANNEWFDGVERSGDRIFALNQASEVWQEWSSTLVAYDLDGNPLWESFFGPEPFNQIGDFAIAGDRLFLGGRRFGSASGSEAVMGAYQLDGSVIGESVLLGIEHISVVLIGPDGDLFLGGQRLDGDIDRWFGRYSVADDVLRWSASEHRVGGTEVSTFGGFDSKHGLYFCGEVGREGFVVRVDPDSGALLWEDRPYEGTTFFGAGANGLAIAGDQIVVVGTTQLPETDKLERHSEGWIAAYTLEGETRWQAIEAADFTAFDGLTAVAGRDDGSVVVAGYQEHEGLAASVDWDVDGLIVEYSADGTRGREVRYDGPLHHEDNFYALSILDNDRVVVAGNSMGSAAAEVGLLAEFELPPLTTPAELPPQSAEDLEFPVAQPGPVGPHAETLYIDFDGASLSPGADGRLGQMTCIDAAFDYPGLDKGRAFVEATVARVREHLEPFDVTVVWEAPPDPTLPYTTVLVGGAPEQLGLEEATQGYACKVDCANQTSNELVLAFATDTELALANTIVHEAAHAWGLDHVVDDDSVMSPFSPVDDAGFLDQCVAISEATSSAVCIESHALFCPAAEQNERAELMMRFGERREDRSAPTLSGLPDGMVTVEPGEAYALAFEVDDDSESPGVELRVPGLEVRTTLDPTEPNYDVYLPPGEHILEVRGIDHAGNETIREVVVRVANAEGGETDGGATRGDDGGGDGGGAEDGTETDTAGADPQGVDSGCACATQRGSGVPALLGWVFVGGVLMRRRRRAPN